MMRHDIIGCLDIGLSKPFLLDVLTEKVLAFLNAEDDIQKAREEAAISLNRKLEIPDLPLQDAFWSCTEILLKHHGLSSFRMLVLSDNSTSRSSVIQFSLEKASEVSYQDQALQLLYLGCLHPLDGKKSRRPRFLCCSIPHIDSNTTFTECEKVSVHFCIEPDSKEELPTLQEKFRSTTYFYQCTVCGIAGTPGLFDECSKCSAVLYCSKRCQTEDWDVSHQDWCSLFKGYMSGEGDLANLPFDFASGNHTTKSDFHELKRKEFFSKFNIFGHGLWRLEYQPSVSSKLNGLVHKDTTLKGYSLIGLENESAILDVCPQRIDQPLNGWSDYYSMRGFMFDSPVAVLLHFPLTLYCIVSQLLPKDFQETFAAVHQSNHLCVHVIGAEKEVEMFSLFLECARLLAPMTVDMHLFGINFDPSYRRRDLQEENLHFRVHRGLYHNMNHEHIPSPTLAVCFNGGIGAYTSYTKTVKLLLKNNTPLYYTDYDQACVAFTTRAITNSRTGNVSTPLINPFRCPLRLVASDQKLPRYSNAFVCYIKPWSESS